MGVDKLNGFIEPANATRASALIFKHSLDEEVPVSTEQGEVAFKEHNTNGLAGSANGLTGRFTQKV